MRLERKVKPRCQKGPVNRLMFQKKWSPSPFLMKENRERGTIASSEEEPEWSTTLKRHSLKTGMKRSVNERNHLPGKPRGA